MGKKTKQKKLAENRSIKTFWDRKLRGDRLTGWIPLNPMMDEVFSHFSVAPPHTKEDRRSLAASLTAGKAGQARQGTIQRREKQKEYASLKARKDEFFKTWEWSSLRYKIIKKYGAACMLCGAVAGDKLPNGLKVSIHVDHIKPISKYWDERLNPDNLQVLCEVCNRGKSNLYEDDFRFAGAAIGGAR